jgi:acyl-CoA reductase-like NAD-dependent aldehyde dehydrogenase
LLAAKGICWSAFYAGGSSCVGTRSVLAEQKIHDRFLDMLRAQLAALRSGAPFDGSTDLAGGIHPVIVPVKSGNSEDEPLSPELARLEVKTWEDEREAVDEINRSPYGLSASVWSRSSSRARGIADRLDVGIVWINDVADGDPGFPWGGNRMSGWGRTMSPETVNEWTRLKVISHDHRLTSRGKLWWFPYSGRKLSMFRVANRILGK